MLFVKNLNVLDSGWDWLISAAETMVEIIRIIRF